MSPAVWDLLAPVVLGVVEGLTEFLPVSSTGHLILAERALGRSGASTAVLDVVIQVGAILAVCWLYRDRLLRVVSTLSTDADSRRFVLNVGLAFLPAAMVGAVAHRVIKESLFRPEIVAVSLIAGGLAILIIERLVPLQVGRSGSDHLPPRFALGVGFCQILALIPGVSRSGATIMGGVAMGIDRRTATEFSFFLAIPTMLGAAGLDLYENHSLLTSGDALAICVGLTTSFAIAALVVRRLVDFVGRRGFAPFGWYRIGAGLITLSMLAT